MKKLVILSFFALLSCTYIEAQEITAITTTNGIAPIPAFTLGKPAGLIFFETKLNNHFSLSPDVSFSLKDGNLWFSDLWIRYSFNPDTAKRWTVIIGVDYPAYIGKSTIDENGRMISKVANYPTGQLCIKRNINKNNSITLDYWYLQAIDMTDGIKGSYLSLSYGFKKSLKTFSFGSNLNVFYLNYSDKTNGFAGSITAKLSHNKSGLFVSAQGMSPIKASKVNADWNASLGISRKLF